MNRTIAQILTPGLPIEKFREHVASYAGDFSFEIEDMIELGEKYLELYPDCFSNRNCGEVQYGYQLVRACVVEKLIAGLDAPAGELFRSMFFDMPRIDECVDALVSSMGTDRARALYAETAARLNVLKGRIDAIPVGMVKERFVGGITQIFNVSYLINMSLDRHVQG